MAEEIINRVAGSKLITFDLEDLYPKGKRETLDISEWLDQGFILRETQFRESIKNHDWQQYSGSFVALHCSTDAIVPAWAYMLVSTQLQNIAQKTIVGTLELLETILYAKEIEKLNTEPYHGVPLIIKGCSNKPVPPNAYLLLIEKLQPITRSIMFGEACSTVPLFKKRI